MAEREETRRKLIVVDDDRDFRALVARVGRETGWQVTEFDDGGAFLSAIGRGLRPDLIILDIVMPNVDGIETVGALGSSSVRCPVVLITGRLPLYIGAARELGLANRLDIVDALRKPIPLQRLRALLAPQA